MVEATTATAPPPPLSSTPPTHMWTSDPSMPVTHPHSYHARNAPSPYSAPASSVSTASYPTPPPPPHPPPQSNNNNNIRTHRSVYHVSDVPSTPPPPQYTKIISSTYRTLLRDLSSVRRRFFMVISRTQESCPCMACILPSPPTIPSSIVVEIVDHRRQMDLLSLE